MVGQEIDLYTLEVLFQGFKCRSPKRPEFDNVPQGSEIDLVYRRAWMKFILDRAEESIEDVQKVFEDILNEVIENSPVMLAHLRAIEEITLH